MSSRTIRNVYLSLRHTPMTTSIDRSIEAVREFLREYQRAAATVIVIGLACMSLPTRPGMTGFKCESSQR